MKNQWILEAERQGFPMERIPPWTTEAVGGTGEGLQSEDFGPGETDQGIGGRGEKAEGAMAPSLAMALLRKSRDFSHGFFMGKSGVIGVGGIDIFMEKQ